MSESQVNQERLDLTLGNTFEELHRAARELERFLEHHAVSLRTAYVCQLAFEEIASNVIKYGHSDESLHEIAVSARLESDALLLEIGDDGHPFDPTRAVPPTAVADVEEAAIGGLGIELVRKLAKSFRYRRVGGRNVTEVRLERTEL